MWRLAKPTSHGGNSVRSVFTMVIAAFLAVLLVSTAIAPEAHAAEASWKGSNTIVYEGNNYLGPAEAALVANLSLPEGAQVFTFIDPAANPSTNSSSSSNSPPVRQMHVIYFASDASLASADQAKYRTYTYNGPNSFSNPSNPTDITIDSQNGAATSGTSACAVESAISWMICSVTDFLASGMDWIYDILSGFLTVQPLQTGQDNALYRAWSYMRSIANVAFVIVFLIIIYSQISNIGIDSYGIKKLLPRLIIAALLVNLSYIICSIAIDISNILGYSIQDVFMSIRETLVGPEGNGWDLVNWESITSFILSGGTIVTAGSIGLFTTLTAYGIGGSLFLLLPALVAGILSVLVAFIIMAARQAIVIILVILAPLAFVAYLLPNTEKWFEKWRSTFMTMLILFPAFSILFGGSQLASAAIIQSADSINMLLLGMTVQVAPLFITPFLIRLGGDLLKQVADFVEKPRQAMQGVVKDFTKDRTDNIKERRLRDLPDNAWGRAQILRRGAIWRDNRRRNREDLAKAAGAEADARWANDRRFRRSDQRVRLAGDVKSIGEARSERQYNLSKLVPDNQTSRLTRNQQIGAELFNTEHELEHAKEEVKYQYSRMQIAAQSDPKVPKLSKSLSGHAMRAVNNYRAAQDLHMQIGIAEGELQAEYAKDLESRINSTNAAIQQATRDAFNLVDKNGYRHALASAKAITDEAMTKAINEIAGNSGVHPGDVAGLRQKLDEAIAGQDLAAMVAYTRLLSQSEDVGIKELEAAIVAHEDSLLYGTKEQQELRADWKHYINYEADVNKYSESMGSWSRDPNPDKRLVIHRDEAATWQDMRLEQFSLMKKSQQMRAIKALIDDGQNEKALRMARELTTDGDLRNNLKQSAVEILEDYVENGSMNMARLEGMLINKPDAPKDDD